MNTNEIKKLLETRNEIIDMIHKCRSSVNEISLSSIYTISLTDLKKNLDLEKYKELEYLFTKENISYLRPYKGSLVGLTDEELGIVSRELVTAEICCLLGIDLAGRHSGGVTGLCNKRKIEIAKKHLMEKNVEIKDIVYFSDILDIRTLWANNQRQYETIRKPMEIEETFYDEIENSLFVVISHKDSEGKLGKMSFDRDIYDLLHSYYRDLKGNIVISKEILDKEQYSKIKEVKTITLEEAIKITLECGFGEFDGDNFFYDNHSKKNPFVYKGDKKDIETFISIIISKMKSSFIEHKEETSCEEDITREELDDLDDLDNRPFVGIDREDIEDIEKENVFDSNCNNNSNIENNEMNFLGDFLSKIEECCLGYDVPELREIIDSICMLREDYYYENYF